MLSRFLKYIPDPLSKLPVREYVTLDRVTTGMSQDDSKPKPLNKLGVGLGEHWGIVGVTGCGKSYFAKSLVEYLRVHYPHARRYIVDSTEDGMEGVKGRIDVRGNKIPSLLRDTSRTQIWTPDTDIPSNYSKWFENILYDRKPAIVVVDEIASLGIDNEGFIKLLKQGRKHGITVIANTQEIAKVTPTLFRMMTHFMLFRINAEPYDMSMARRYLSVEKEAQRQPVGKYGFFYRRVDGPNLHREFTSMQSFFKR